jgi:hypothetical protein
MGEAPIVAKLRDTAPDIADQPAPRLPPAAVHINCSRRSSRSTLYLRTTRRGEYAATPSSSILLIHERVPPDARELLSRTKAGREEEPAGGRLQADLGQREAVPTGNPARRRCAQEVPARS